MTDNDGHNLFAHNINNCLESLKGIYLEGRSALLGARWVADGLEIPFYGERYRVTRNGVCDAAGRPANPALTVMLLRYVADCPATIPQKGDWVSYREFEGAGPLNGHFTENTHKVIESAFAGRTNDLITAAHAIGGTDRRKESSFDISIQFQALPRIPVLLYFNDTDDLFPAQCSLLFRKSAEVYLDLRSLGVAGTYLTGKLIRFHR